MSISHYYNGRRNRAGKPLEALQGIPARDLTDEEVARFDKDQVKALSIKGSDGKQLYTTTKPNTEPPKTAKGGADADTKSS